MTKLKLNEIRSCDLADLQKIAYQKDLNRLHKQIANFVEVNCPACNSNTANFIFNKYKCNFMQCRNCDAKYMSPRPTEEIMDDYYKNSENYKIWNEYIFPQSEVARKNKICQPNLDKVIEECERLEIKYPSLLEIGPGFGTFAQLANNTKYFSKITVVERTPEMVAACTKRGLTVIDHPLESLPNQQNPIADVIVFFEVLEHIFNPKKFLSIIDNLLKPGGLIIFTCPNAIGFDTLTLQEKSPAVDTEHVNLFSPKSIDFLIKEINFDLISIETPGRLDVEIVHQSYLANELDISNQPFLQKLFNEESEDLRNNFQKFLIENNLSGNMRVIARKPKK